MAGEEPPGKFTKATLRQTPLPVLEEFSYRELHYSCSYSKQLQNFILSGVRIFSLKELPEEYASENGFGSKFTNYQWLDLTWKFLIIIVILICAILMSVLGILWCVFRKKFSKKVRESDIRIRKKIRLCVTLLLLLLTLGLIVALVMAYKMNEMFGDVTKPRSRFVSNLNMKARAQFDGITRQITTLLSDNFRELKMYLSDYLQTTVRDMLEILKINGRLNYVGELADYRNQMDDLLVNTMRFVDDVRFFARNMTVALDKTQEGREIYTNTRLKYFQDTTIKMDELARLDGMLESLESIIKSLKTIHQEVETMLSESRMEKVVQQINQPILNHLEEQELQLNRFEQEVNRKLRSGMDGLESATRIGSVAAAYHLGLLFCFIITLIAVGLLCSVTLGLCKEFGVARILTDKVPPARCLAATTWMIFLTIFVIGMICSYYFLLGMVVHSGLCKSSFSSTQRSSRQFESPASLLIRHCKQRETAYVSLLNDKLLDKLNISLFPSAALEQLQCPFCGFAATNNIFSSGTFAKLVERASRISSLQATDYGWVRNELHLDQINEVYQQLQGNRDVFDDDDYRNMSCVLQYFRQEIDNIATGKILSGAENMAKLHKHLMTHFAPDIKTTIQRYMANGLSRLFGHNFHTDKELRKHHSPHELYSNTEAMFKNLMEDFKQKAEDYMFSKLKSCEPIVRPYRALMTGTCTCLHFGLNGFWIFAFIIFFLLLPICCLSAYLKELYPYCPRRKGPSAPLTVKKKSRFKMFGCCQKKNSRASLLGDTNQKNATKSNPNTSFSGKTAKNYDPEALSCGPKCLCGTKCSCGPKCSCGTSLVLTNRPTTRPKSIMKASETPVKDNTVKKKISKLLCCSKKKNPSEDKVNAGKSSNKWLCCKKKASKASVRDESSEKQRESAKRSSSVSFEEMCDEDNDKAQKTSKTWLCCKKKDSKASTVDDTSERNTKRKTSKTWLCCKKTASKEGQKTGIAAKCCARCTCNPSSKIQCRKLSKLLLCCKKKDSKASVKSANSIEDKSVRKKTSKMFSCCNKKASQATLKDEEKKKTPDKSAKKWSCCAKKPSKVTQSKCYACSDRDLRNNLVEQSKVERVTITTQTEIVGEQLVKAQDRVKPGGGQLSEDDYEEQEKKKPDEFVKEPSKITQPESCICPDGNLRNKLRKQSKVEEQLKEVHERVEFGREEKKKRSCCAKKPSKVIQPEYCQCSDHDLRNKLEEQSKVEQTVIKTQTKIVEEQLKEAQEWVEPGGGQESKKPDKFVEKLRKVTNPESCICPDCDLLNKLGEQSKVDQATITTQTKIVEEHLKEAQERVEPGGSQVPQRSAPMVAPQVVVLSDQTAGIVPVGQYGPQWVCDAGCQCKSRARRKRKVRQRMIGPQVLQPVNGLFADRRSQQIVEQQTGTISGEPKLYYFITPQWDEQTDDESSARERDGSTSSRESRRKRKLTRRGRRRNRRRALERGYQTDGSSSRQQMSQSDDRDGEQFSAGECASSADSEDSTDKCRADVNSGQKTKRSLSSPTVEEQLSEWNMQTQQEYFGGERASSTKSRKSRRKRKAKRRARRAKSRQLTDDDETPGRGLQSKGQHTADAEEDEQFSAADCDSSSSSKDARHEWKASGSRNRVGKEVSGLEPAILNEGLSVHRMHLANISTVDPYEQFAGESSSSASSRDSGRKRTVRRKGRRDSSSQCTDEEEMSKRDLPPMVQFAPPQMPGHSTRISGHQQGGSSLFKAEQQMGEQFLVGERDSSDDSKDSRDQRETVRSTRSAQGNLAQEVSELDIISDERFMNVQQMQQPNTSKVEAQKSQSALRRVEEDALFSEKRDSSSGSKESRNIWKTKRKARSRSSVQFADEQPMSARNQKSVEFSGPEILGTNSAVGRWLGNAHQMPKSSVSLVEPQTSWQMGEQFSSGRRRSSIDLRRKSKVRAKRKARSGSSESIKGGKISAASSIAINDQLQSNTSLTEQFVSKLQMILPKVAIDKKLTDERNPPKAEKATSWLDETLVGATPKGDQSADEEKTLTESTKKPTDQPTNNVEASSATLRQLKYRQQMSPSPLRTDDQFTDSRCGIVDCRLDCFADQSRRWLEEFQNVGRADNGQQICMQTAQSAGQLTYRRPTPTPTQKRTTDQNIQVEKPIFDQGNDESEWYEQPDRSAGRTPWLKDIQPKSTLRAPTTDRFTHEAKQRTDGEVRERPQMSTLKVLTDAQFRDRQQISEPYMQTEDWFVPQPEPRIRFVDEDPYEKETPNQSVRTGTQLTAKPPMLLSHEQSSQQRMDRQQISGSDGHRADRPLRQGPQYKVGQFKVKLKKPSKGTLADEQRTDRWTTSRNRGGKETEPIERHQMPGISKQRRERLERQQRGTIASKSNDARRRKSKRTLKMTGIRVYRKPKSQKESECSKEDFDVDP